MTSNFPQIDQYREPIRNLDVKKYGKARQRWVFKLNKDYYILQRVSNEKGRSLENSEVYRIYNDIITFLNEPLSTIKKNTFIANDTPKENNIIPVIYQAAIDSWKNFVREVHCYKINENEYEVTILFKNEQLRKHGKWDLIYRIFRRLRYGRVTDIESFRIILKEG